MGKQHKSVEIKGKNIPFEELHRFIPPDASALSSSNFDSAKAEIFEFPKALFDDPGSGVMFDSPYNHGWVLWGRHDNIDPKPVSLLQVSITVPPVPDNDNLQKLFIFPALHDAGYTRMLQCVLQYGLANSGGGDFWTVSYWQIIKNSNLTRITPAIRVDSGQSFVAEIRYLTTGHPPFTYGMAFKGLIPQVFISDPIGDLPVCSIVLETQGVSSRDQYPAVQGTLISNIILQAGGHPIPFQWRNSSQQTTHGEHLDFNNNNPTQLGFNYGGNQLLT